MRIQLPAQMHDLIFFFFWEFMKLWKNTITSKRFCNFEILRDILIDFNVDLFFATRMTEESSYNKRHFEELDGK